MTLDILPANLNLQFKEKFMVEGVEGNIDGAVDAGAGVSVGGDSLELAQVLQVRPSSVAAPGAAVDYKGYEALNLVFIHASIALLARLNLLGGSTIGQKDILAAGPEQRYLQASLDCLEACGFLERREDKVVGNGASGAFYEFTSRGVVLA